MSIHSQKNRDFFNGRSPHWDDIQYDFDAERDDYASIYRTIDEYALDENEQGPLYVVVSGHAGSGKSTLAKRLALDLVKGGRRVYHTHSDSIPTQSTFRQFVCEEIVNAVYVFDNVDRAHHQVSNLCFDEHVMRSRNVFVFFTRTSCVDKFCSSMPDEIRLFKFDLSNISRNEASRIVMKLAEHGKLGVMQSMTHIQRVDQFLRGTRQYLLVALKQAVNGRFFNEIVQSDYDELQAVEERQLLIIISLCTEQAMPLPIEDIIALSGHNQNTILNILNFKLRGKIIEVGQEGRSYMIYHRMIAEMYLNVCSSLVDKSEAYKQMLLAISSRINYGQRNSRMIRLFRELIGHHNLFTRFGDREDVIRDIYEHSLRHYEGNYHFWLHWGAFETEARNGNLDDAESYLRSAFSLNDRSTSVKTELAYCLFKRGFYASNYTDASRYSTEARELINSILEDRDDMYAFEVSVIGRVHFAIMWYSSNVTSMRAELHRVHQECESKYSENKLNKRLAGLSDRVKRLLLSTATDEFVHLSKRPTWDSLVRQSQVSSST